MTLPLLASIVVVGVVLLPSLEPAPPRVHLARVGAAAAGAAACWIGGPWGSLALAVATALHARSARDAAALGPVAAAHALAALLLAAGHPDAAVIASLLALAARGGTLPWIGATSDLAARSPSALVELGGTGVAAVVAHLRDVAPASPSVAAALTEPVVLAGALLAAGAGVACLTRGTLRGLWASSVSVHGGTLLAAVGAAGHGHVAPAVFVAVSFALALGGFGSLLEAIEARVGPVDLRGPGGRSVQLPRATWALGFFAAAGVALPGTVGFAADDLVLHALWEVSAPACGLAALASALLAVGLLRGWNAAFLGPPGPVGSAPDLSRREGLAVAALSIALVGFGVWPMALLGPTLAAFG